MEEPAGEDISVGSAGAGTLAGLAIGGAVGVHAAEVLGGTGCVLRGSLESRLAFAFLASLGQRRGRCWSGAEEAY